MAGLTTAGFTIKRLAEILDDMEARAILELGEGAQLEDTSVLGTLIRLFAGMIDPCWQQLQLAHDFLNPDNASGVALDNVAGLIGIERLAATKSTATLALTGTVGTLVPSGTQYSVGPSGDVYVQDADRTLTGSDSVTVTAQEAGFKQATAGAIDTIKTPVAGLSSINQAADAVPGRDAETDAQLRASVKKSNQAIGASTRGSLEARVQQIVDNVSDALVIENVTDLTVGALPPHSIQVVIDGSPVLTELGDFFKDNIGIGVETVGASSVSVIDSRGNSHTFKYDTVTIVNMEFEITVTTDGNYPTDGDTQIKTAIDDYIKDEQLMGADVLLYRIICAVAEVSGIVTITAKQTFLGGVPVEADFAIALTERAAIQTPSTDIVVISS